MLLSEALKHSAQGEFDLCRTPSPPPCNAKREDVVYLVQVIGSFLALSLYAVAVKSVLGGVSRPLSIL